MFSLIFLGIFLALIVIFVSLQFYSLIFQGFAPFISTNDESIRKIVASIKDVGINLDGRKTIYELGCGQAGFLRALEKEYPGTKLIGIEYNFFPYLLSKIKICLEKKKIVILRDNFFAVNLQAAALIYCYLNIATMKKLKEKFSRECQAGTIIISRGFSLPETEAVKIIRDKSDVIYFYKL